MKHLKLVQTTLAAVLAATTMLVSVGASASIEEAIAQEAEAIAEQVIAWRRDIHQHPELSNREFRTAELVAKHLESLGMQVRRGVAHTGRSA